MSKPRLIHPDLFTSEEFIGLTPLARLLWIGIICRLADDEGRGKADAVALKCEVFPADSISIQDVRDLRAEIERTEMIWIGRLDDGAEYFVIPKWTKWQSLRYVKPSKYPDRNGLTSLTQKLRNFSLEEKRREEKCREEKRRESSPGADSQSRPDDDARPQTETDDARNTFSPEKLLDFALEVCGIKPTKTNRKTAKLLVKTFSAQHIKGGITLGVHRAEQAGTKPKTLTYFRGPIEEVASIQDSEYTPYLLRKGGFESGPPSSLKTLVDRARREKP